MDAKEVIVVKFPKGSRIVVLTGAGVSASAGIPTFQATDDDWNYEVPRNLMMTPKYLKKQPVKFWNMYREVFGDLYRKSYAPTVFHRWVAGLENDHEVMVATQNIDGLHQLAGSTNVVEMHGTIRELVDVRESLKNGSPVVFDAQDFGWDEKGFVPTSPVTGNVLKPNVVLFNEGIVDYDVVRDYLRNEATHLVIAGTRLEVGPVNQLPYEAMFGKNFVTTMFVGPDPAPRAYEFTKRYRMTADTFAESFENL